MPAASSIWLRPSKRPTCASLAARPNPIRSPMPNDETKARVAAGLRELGNYAGPLKVTVIIESHDHFTASATLKSVLQSARFRARRPALGRASHLCHFQRRSGIHRQATGPVDPPHPLERFNRQRRKPKVCLDRTRQRPRRAPDRVPAIHRIQRLLLFRMGEGLASGSRGPGNRHRRLRASRRSMPGKCPRLRFAVTVYSGGLQ